MRKLVLFLVVVLLFILGAGISTLPEVLSRGYAIPSTETGLPEMPTGLYLLTLANLVLFVGVLLSIAVHHYLRTMIGLFVIGRVAEIIWEYVLDRHSLWYLIISVAVYLIVGGGAIYLLSRADTKDNVIRNDL